MDYESLQRDLQAARLRGARFQQRAQEAVEGAALLPDALEELSTALEELRVADEQLRAQQEQLAQARQTVETERDQCRELFEAAPAAYLVTDRVGVIQQANRRAAGLLGVAQQFLVGRPLAMFVVGEDRWALRDRLGRGGGLEGAAGGSASSHAATSRSRPWWRLVCSTTRAAGWPGCAGCWWSCRRPPRPRARGKPARARRCRRCWPSW